MTMPSCSQSRCAAHAISRAMICAALLFAASWLPAAHAQPATADHPIRYSAETTPGGLPFQYRRDPITPYASVTFGWSINSEQRAREGFRGMLGSLLVSGVYPQQPTEFFEKLADLYATASIGIGDNQFIAEAKAPAKELAEALDLVLRAIRTGTPNAKTFRRTRTSFINSEKQAEKNPQSQVSRSASLLLLGDHPITRGFDPKRFDNIRLADIATWRKSAFDEGPLQIVVSGRLSIEEAGRLLDKAFAGWPKSAAKERPKPALVAAKPTSVAVATTGKQTIVQLVAPTAKIEGRELLTAGLAQAVLGAGPSSRLFNSVRAALGSTYGASASLSMIGPEQRALTLAASVDPNQVDASIAALRKAYAEWYDTGITEPEFASQRERMQAGFLSSFRDPAGANRAILNLLLAGRSPNDNNDYEQRLAALKREDVNAFIKARFPRPDDLMLVVGTPEGSTYVSAACQVKTWREVETACAQR